MIECDCIAVESRVYEWSNKCVYMCVFVAYLSVSKMNRDCIYHGCTYQWFTTFDQLYDFHRFLVLVHLDRYIGQMRIEIFLCYRIVCGKQALQV